MVTMRVFIAVIFLATAVNADEISKSLESAKGAYESKEYVKAIDELSFAIAKIRKLNYQEKIKLLPKPLDGWVRKDKISNSNIFFNSITSGGAKSITLTSKYTKGKERVDISINAHNTLVQSLSMMLNNPMFISNSKNMSISKYKGKKLIKESKRGGKVVLTLQVDSNILIQVQGRYLEDDTILMRYLDSIDLEAVKKSLN